MKPLVKKSFSVFVLLLIVFGQLGSSFYQEGNVTSYAAISPNSGNHTAIAKAVRTDEILMEEVEQTEEDRFAFRNFNSFASNLYAFSGAFFTANSINVTVKSFSFRNFSFLSPAGSSNLAFCVLRL